MPHQFQKHYTLDEARALLPQVRGWLGQMQATRERLKIVEDRISHLLASGSDAAGGSSVNEQIKLLADLQNVALEFSRREIQIKDVSRGLLDFPAIIGGREVFLCWEQDEEDIEHWHELDAGFAGRERL
jgi:hypothetical protein